MAIKTKAKPKPQTRAAAKSFDEKNYGPEPFVVDNERLANALNWYNYMHDQDQARSWLLEYMKAEKFDRSQVAAARNYSKNRLVSTVGWLARIMMNGNVLTPATKARFDKSLKEMLAADDKDTVIVEKPVVDIQARIRARAYALITMVEEGLDTDLTKFDIYTFLQKNEVTPQIAGYIREYYLPKKEEVMLDDEQVKEAYGIGKYAKTRTVNPWPAFYCNFIADCDKFINNKKAVKIRKPREKKIKSAVDLIKALKYQKEEPSLRIVSVHPTEVVGCNQLWVYNTKYKKLTQYISMSPHGIQVKGTTLTGWDTELSVSKSLRKPEITTAEILKLGKVAIRSYMTSLKTAASAPNGRVNEQTILLRVIK